MPRGHSDGVRVPTARHFFFFFRRFYKFLYGREEAARMVVERLPAEFNRMTQATRSLSFFAKSAVTFMEVILVETKKILSTIGTFIIVGAVSTAEAALWTNVLDDKLKLVKAKKTHSKSDKVIVVDFKKARRDMSR